VTFLIALPILIPLATAASGFIAAASPSVQRRLTLVGTVALLASTIALLAHVLKHGTRVHQAGDWPPPIAVPLVADPLSGIVLVTAALLGLAVVVYSRQGVDRRRKALAYYPLVQILLFGTCGALLAGDLFNLFVWFEVMLVSSFVLLVLGGERAQLEGGMKYVTMNLLASLLLLTGIGLVYRLTGTLNLGALSMAMRDVPGNAALAAAMVLLVALGIKAAAFPVFSWLPAAYAAPPVAISAIFSALLTKVAVYAMFRIFTVVFAQDSGEIRPILLACAGLTMLTGVLGAMVQMDVRRLLAFHVVSQIGYLLMGLGLGSPLALLGAVFFMVHIMFAKAALFLVSGITHTLRGTYQLDRMGGIAREHPGIAVLFLLPALSMAGLPPLSGFFAKLILIRAGLEAGAYAMVAVAAVVSLLTLYSMIKIWTLAFWGTPPVTVAGRRRPGPGMLVPTAALAGLVLVIGIAAEPVALVAGQAADALLATAAYAEAVAGSGR